MSDHRIPRVFRSASQDEPHAPVEPSTGQRPYDPLKLCIATTVAIIAWLVTPPLAVAVFASIALVGYTRARRAGLMSSRCMLGDTRLVLAYLAVALVAGLAGVAWNVWQLLS